MKEQVAEMLKTAISRKKKWLETNGFNEDENTYIIFGDSYSIKDELKDAGWKFSRQFLWHKPDPAGYEDRVIKLNINEIIDYWYPSGLPAFKENAADWIQQKLNNAIPPSNSEWIDGDRVDLLPVTFISKREYDGYYGLTNILTFKTEEDNMLTWFTSTNPRLEKGFTYFISGKIKDRKEYKGVKTTVLTRCKIQ